jgi:Galactose oxidase, central domain/Kelch motif
MVTGTLGGMPARRVANLVIALAVLALGACNGGGGDDPKSSPAPAPARSTTSGPVIPVARTEVAGAVWDGKIAVAGGFPSPDQAVERLDLFDVASGTWSVGPPLPHQYDHSSLAELGGRLYVVGGYTGGLSNPTNEVWSLGPGEQAWTDEPDLATRRGALASGKLVAVGGVDELGNVLSSTEIFTPGTGWSPGPNLSKPREHLAAAGAGDKVYAIAGRNPDGATRSVESFIVGSDQWNDEGALHVARSGIGAGTTSSGRVCTGGGEVPGRHDTVPSIECYDGQRWRRVADMNVPRHGLAVVAEGKQVHLVAGGPQPGFSFSDAHEVLEL